MRITCYFMGCDSITAHYIFDSNRLELDEGHMGQNAVVSKMEITA